MLKEASYFDIKVKVYPGVFVFVVNAESTEDPSEYVFKLVSTEI